MKQFDVLINALQDIIAETFETEENSNLHLPAIREMAQKALSKYNKSIPKPETVSYDCLDSIRGEEHDKH